MGPDAELLHNLAVYRSYENLNNREFRTTFFGHDQESVRILSERALANADKMASPRLAAMTEYFGRINGGAEAKIYSMTLTTFSLD